MSQIPQSKQLAKLAGKRKRLAFLSVAGATFFCLCLIWPLSTKSWRSESEISLTLTRKKGSADDFKMLLDDVVKRHTTVEAIARSLDQNGIIIEGRQVDSREIATEIRKRLEVVMLDTYLDPDHRSIRVGLNGGATEKDKFYVNLLATTMARDLMTSPLAGILPVETVPVEDIESLQRQHAEIERRANELLTQIQTNLNQSAYGLVQTNESTPAIGQSSASTKITGLQADQNEDGPFKMASHTLNRMATRESLMTTFESLRVTISDLANVAAQACTAAETASTTRPAFSIAGVQGKTPVPIGAIPSGQELLFLTLASCVFATIVSFAYQPFAERGFESLEQIEKKLKLPVVATLESKNEFEDVTGPGIPAESVKAEMPGSNQVVNICKWILFCGLMLTIGFCLVNAEIRDAFMVSPFHGFAEIVWTMKGY